ncbi:MAG: spore cortex biosynthesis protein YabQ [Clostridia bacterium]|nr:spore cortex biosynthesis protein YabQ [Clostridia bacterium]
MQGIDYVSNIIVALIIGVILGIIFDFFRSLRKVTRPKNSVVMIQDIIYFAIVLIVMITATYLYLDDALRMYIVVIIILSALIYFKLFSKFIVNIYVFVIKRTKKLITDLLLPFRLIFEIFQKIYIFFKKIVKKCCINFINMLTYLYKRGNFISKLKQKKKVKYEEKGKKVEI